MCRYTRFFFYFLNPLWAKLLNTCCVVFLCWAKKNLMPKNKNVYLSNILLIINGI